MTALGYPLHFIVLLGVWKVLGSADTARRPAMRLVKEWGLRRHLHRPLRRRRGVGSQRGGRVPRHRAHRPHRHPRRVLGAAPGEPAIARREREGGHTELGVWGAFARRHRSTRQRPKGGRAGADLTATKTKKFPLLFRFPPKAVPTGSNRQRSGSVKKPDDLAPGTDRERCSSPCAADRPITTTRLFDNAACMTSIEDLKDATSSNSRLDRVRRRVPRCLLGRDGPIA